MASARIAVAATAARKKCRSRIARYRPENGLLDGDMRMERSARCGAMESIR